MMVRLMRETLRNTDHSELSHTVNALLFSNEVIEALFNESPVGILISDLKGNIQRINRVGVESLGSPSEEATKKINLLTFPPLRDVGFSEIFHKCAKDMKPIIKEIPYVSK